jgi:hypothetical protein
MPPSPIAEAEEPEETAIDMANPGLDKRNAACLGDIGVFLSF